MCYMDVAHVLLRSRFFNESAYVIVVQTPYEECAIIDTWHEMPCRLRVHQSSTFHRRLSGVTCTPRLGVGIHGHDTTDNDWA